MKFEKNDPRLVAFVMQELSPAERVEVEAALESQPELRQEVLLIERTLGVFKSAYQSESQDTLLLEQRARVLGHTEKSRRGFWFLGLTGLTVGLASLVLFMRVQDTSVEQRQSLADSTQENLNRSAPRAGGMALKAKEKKNEASMAEARPQPVQMADRQEDPQANKQARPEAPPARHFGAGAKKSDGQLAPTNEEVSSAPATQFAKMAEKDEAAGSSDEMMAAAAPKQEGRSARAKFEDENLEYDSAQVMSLKLTARLSTRSDVSEQEAQAGLDSLKNRFQKCLDQRLSEPGPERDWTTGSMAFKVTMPTRGVAAVELLRAGTTQLLLKDPLGGCLSSVLSSNSWPRAKGGAAIYRIVLDIVSN